MKKLLLLLVLVPLLACEPEERDVWHNEFVFYKLDDTSTLLINDKLMIKGFKVSINTDESNYKISQGMDAQGVLHISFYREADYDNVTTDMYKVEGIDEEIPWIDKSENEKYLRIPKDKLNEPVYNGYYYFMVSVKRRG